MVGIICALPRELAALKRRRPAGCRILAAGMGAAAATRGAESLVASDRLNALISAGYAGGLIAPALPGAVIVDTTDERVDCCFLDEFRGRIAPANGMIKTPEDRARLAAQTGAVAVDMESAAVAAVAQRHRLPFAAVRAITDGPDSRLVLDWDGYRDERGQFATAAAVWGALRTTGGMEEMLEFWYASRKASRALAASLDDFLERWSILND